MKQIGAVRGLSFKGVLPVVTVGGSALLLAGCTLAMGSLNGIGYCPPEVNRAAMYNNQTLSQLQPGAYLADFEAYAIPEKKEKLTTSQGVLDVWTYRTGHKDCAAIARNPATMQVIMFNGQVLAVGPNAVARFTTSQLNQ